MNRIKLIIKNILIMIINFLIISLISGCATSKYNWLYYESDFRSTHKVIPIDAELIITANISQLPSQVRKDSGLNGLLRALEEDVNNNLFNSDEYKSSNVILRLNLHYLKDNNDARALLSLLWFPLLYVGVPIMKYTAEVEISLEIEHRSGERVSQYVSNDTLSKYVGLYYGWSSFTQSGYLPREVTKNAMLNIKKHLINDKNTIIARINELDKNYLSNGVKPLPPIQIQRSVYKNVKFNVAVFDLKAVGVSESLSLTLSQFLRDELYRLKVFNLINRTDMVNILSEHSLTMTGAVDDSKILINSGKLFSVQKMIFGSINRIGTNYSISLSLVDVETSRIEKNSLISKICSDNDLVYLLRETIIQLLTDENL